MCMAVLTATTKPIGVTTDKYFLDTALTAVQRWRTEDEILNLIRSFLAGIELFGLLPYGQPDGLRSVAGGWSDLRCRPFAVRHESNLAGWQYVDSTG